MTNAYEQLPEGIKQELDGSCWPHAKAMIKNELIAAKSIRDVRFGTIQDLILFGLDQATEQDRTERFRLITNGHEIQRILDITLQPKTN